jgi:hypothetical protein
MWAAAGCVVAAEALNPDPQPLIRKVADRVMEDYPKPVKFNWGEGVLMAGMMRGRGAERAPLRRVCSEMGRSLA